MSRKEYLVIALCALLGWLILWSVAAGFAGKLQLLPDTALPVAEFVIFTAFYYAAPALTVWASLKFLRLPKEGRADD